MAEDQEYYPSPCWFAMVKTINDDLGITIGLIDELTIWIEDVMPHSNHFLQLKEELLQKVRDAVG